MHNARPAGRRIRHALLAAVVALVAVAILPVAAQAQTAGPPSRAQVVAFGRTVEALARANDAAAIADLFVADKYTCPIDQMPWAQACQDKPDGAVVDGYRVGRMQSEGTVVDRVHLESTLAEFLGYIPASSTTLRTVALRGFGDCPACAVMVFAAGVPGSSAVPSLLLLQVSTADGGLVVYSAIGGVIPADGDAIVTGGAWSQLEFVAVDADPGAPSTGSGTASPPGLAATPVLLALLALGAAIALAGATLSRRRR